MAQTLFEKIEDPTKEKMQQETQEKEMKDMDRNELARVVHQANIKWWQDIHTGEPIARDMRELLALIISEVAECLEGERKDLMDDKLTHRKMAEVEMADAYIRILDFSAGFGFKLINPDSESWPAIPENKGAALYELMVLITISATFHSLSDSLTYIEKYCDKHGYDLLGAFKEKMAFNAVREDHKHEARRIAGGKQF